MQTKLIEWLKERVTFYRLYRIYRKHMGMRRAIKTARYAWEHGFNTKGGIRS